MTFRLLLLTLSLLTNACATECIIQRGDVTETVLLDGTIEPSRAAEVLAPFDGPLVWVEQDGKAVSKGEPIAQIDTWEIEGELQKSRLKRKQKELERQKLRAEQDLEVLQDQADLKSAQAELEAAQWLLESRLKARDAVDLKRKRLEIRKQEQMREFYQTYLSEIEELADQGAYSQTELEELRLKVRETEINLKRARIDLKKLIEGEPLDIETARREVESARLKLKSTREKNHENKELRVLAQEVLQAELEELQDDFRENLAALQSATVTAPVTGVLVIDTHWSGTGVEAYDEGHKVEKSSRFARIALPGGLDAQLKAHETDAGRIQLHQTARIQILPLGNAIHPARITHIGRTLDEMASWRKDRYRLRTLMIQAEFADKVPRMRPKMSITARIESKTLQNVLRLPAHCLNPRGTPIPEDPSLKAPHPILVNTRFAAFAESDTSIGARFTKPRRYQKNHIPKDSLIQPVSRSLREFIPGAGELESREETYLVPAFEAKIETLAQSGSEVASGDAVATLETEELQANLSALQVEASEKRVEKEKAELTGAQEIKRLNEELRQARQLLAEQNARIQMLDSSDPKLEQSQKEVSLEIAAIEKKYEESRFQVQSNLKTRGFLKAEDYQQNFEQLQEALIEEEVAILELELAQSPKSSLERKRQRALRKSFEADVHRLKESIAIRKRLSETASELAEMESRIAAYEASRTEDSIQRATLHAPRSGVFIVGEKWKNRSLEPMSEGDQVGPGLVLGKIVQMDNFRIRGRVAEPEFHRIRKGQDVKFSLTTRPGSSFQARVTDISPIPVKRAIFGREEPVVELTMQVLETSKAFQPGASVTFELMASPGRKALMIPLKAVHEIDGELVVATQNRGLQEVRIGQVQAEEVEILQGLEAQDRVWIEGSQP